MKVLVIRFAVDSEVMQKFYATIGLNLHEESSGECWMEMRADGGGTVAVHRTDPEHAKSEPLKFCLHADEPLADIQARLVAAGFDGGEIVEEPDFGHSLRVHDPEGQFLQIDGE